jgi:predicted dehydrogenase
LAKTRAVLVGAGGISRAWFGALAAEKVEVAGVVDLVRKRARERIAQFELDCPTGTDLRAMLRATGPDFVVDCTVPEAHCEVTCAALRAGCHVIGEKPMASTMAEARKMVRAAERADRVFMVGPSRRWNPRHVVVQKLARGPRLGQLTTANCDFYIGAHFDGFRAKMPSPLLLDMAIHHFDLARFFCGGRPVGVYAKEFNPAGSSYRGDVAASCIFEMSNGIVFTYRGSWCAEGPGTSWNGDWRIIGTNGALLYERDQTPVAKVVAARKGFCYPLRDVPAPREAPMHGGQRGALREMLRFLRRGTLPQTECHDNIHSLAMVHGAIESSRKGRRVAIRV